MTITQFKALAPAKAKADAAWHAFEAARSAHSRAVHRAEVARVRRKTTWAHWMQANTTYLALLSLAAAAEQEASHE